MPEELAQYIRSMTLSIEGHTLQRPCWGEQFIRIKLGRKGGGSKA